MWFTRISIHNPVFATMMMGAILVLGLFSYKRLSIDQFPDISLPVVVVQTEYPGASPEVVESDVTRRVEEIVNTVSGIRNLSSRSYENLSLVIVEFDLFTNPVEAAQNVREKLALVRASFRDEVKEPTITRFNPDDYPVLSLAVLSDTRSLRELTTLSDQIIKKRLENVRGVGRTQLVGGVRREVQVLLRPADMEALQIGPEQVLAALRSENQELPAGTLVTREREQVVQVKGRFERPADFARLIVARRGGQSVTLGQIATLVDGEQEPETAALVDGVPGLSVDVVKSQGANTIDTVDGVRRAIDSLRAELPPDIRLQVVRDTSVSIRNSVANVQRTLVEGALLTVLIVFLFLGSWRSTVITGLTLPISLIGTFLVMYAMGFTINLLTLLALSICVGLLIDDAIVVRENIVRHLAMGKPHREAALEGTREIGLAVLATTLSIVAVFLPVGFMGGIVGKFFHQFGVTVAFAVLLSMFVSFTLDPMLSSVWYDPDSHAGGQGLMASRRNPVGMLLRGFQRLMTRLEQGYVALLRWGLRHRIAVLLLALGCFAGSFGLLRWVGTEFVPQPDNNELLVQFNTPVGASLELTRDKASQVEAALRGFPGVTDTYTTIGAGNAAGKNYATVFAKLVDRSKRPLSVQQMQQPVRERLGRIAGITVTNVGVFAAVSSGKPVQVSILGQDIQELDRLAAAVMSRMQAVDGVVDLDSSSKPAKPSVSVRLNRELASDLGIGLNQVARAVRPLLAGEVAGSWKAPDGENYDVRVRLPRAARASVEDIERLYLVSNPAGADGNPRMVPLRQIAQLEQGMGAAQINRKALTREVLLSANVQGRPAGDVSRDIQARLADIPLQPGYRFVTGGSAKDIQETMGYALQALALAIVFIYLILASQFGSFLQPVAIMMSLPLSLIGVIIALLLWRSTLNMFSIIGFIMLMGLVTKNAILLIDFINQSVRAGMTRHAAILEAAQVRLRPILMTTLAMVFGMLPLALALGEGSEQRAPMAHAVIGGVIASTLLTLIVVPVVYTYLDDVGARFRSKMKGLRADAPDPTGVMPAASAGATRAAPSGSGQGSV